MAAKPVKIAYVADTAELRSSLAKAEAAMEATGTTAQAAGSKVDAAFDSTAEHADTVASKGSQAAGALSGLGDLAGGKFGSGMVVAGTAMQGFADAGDLVNVVTQSNIVKKTKDIAVTAAHRAATLASSAASKAAAIAQRLLNAAMSANPIGLVITGLTLLAAGFVVAYKKSETFRNIVNGAFDKVKSVVEAVGGAFKTVWDGVSKWLGKAWDFISGLPGKIKGAFSGLWDGLAGGLKSALNAVLHLPLTIPRINTHIPGVGTVGGQTLIPALAKGGIVDRPTLALIGEAGPEAVVPLNREHSALLGGGRSEALLEQILEALVGSQETVGRAIAQESGRGWTETRQNRRARALGGVGPRLARGY